MDNLSQPSVQEIDLVSVLAALADPVRLAIMRALYRDEGPIDCSIVAADIKLTPATVSHHWRVLRQAGLTATTKHGRSRKVEVRRADLANRFPGLLEATLAID
ncbi:ArsR/SmtB family transcription factor [Psychromicrobium lacuslunae]|uniref:ArsR family transcriptional regulator n=1 Tax=Psychromicrobium lacuslunae TaxID=1618207 RepID=A0A0D4BZ60_9MICC|nr:helix-turn-helix domain-containing protein [Psychromicrobium lacuslunae]AJT41406.1 ArsR family transcriptional regulator [Psychromicrobium lacuslunae]